MRRFAVVTTMHPEGYERYGRLMVQSFLQHFPAAVPLLLYHENFVPDVIDPRLIPRDLLRSSPELVEFKRRHVDNRRAHGRANPWRRIKLFGLRIPVPLRIKKGAFRWDAVRFSHKTFCIFHAARHVDADVLIWIDADTRFFADVDLQELETMVPEDCFVGCLQRRNYSECGFVAYNLRDPATAGFLADFERYYTQDRLFAEREYHDSFLFDIARRRAEQRGAKSYDIGEGVGQRASHVLINSRLGRFMDHMKGDRKHAGQSRAGDLLAERSEAYWKQLPPSVRPGPAKNR